MLIELSASCCFLENLSATFNQGHYIGTSKCLTDDLIRMSLNYLHSIFVVSKFVFCVKALDLYVVWICLTPNH